MVKIHWFVHSSETQCKLTATLTSRIVFLHSKQTQFVIFYFETFFKVEQ